MSSSAALAMLVIVAVSGYTTVRRRGESVADPDRSTENQPPRL